MQSEERQIDWRRILRALGHKFWLLLLLTVTGGAIGFTWSAYFITPLYQSEAMLYVNNSDISLGNIKASITSQDLSAAQSLVDTYTVILKTRNTLDDVIKEDNLDYSFEELSDMIDADSVNGTEVFSVTVTDKDPQEAEEIANTIAHVLPTKISDIVEGSSAEVVDYAVVPATKSSPDIAKYTAIGCIIGLLLAMLIVTIKEVLNDQIKSESDLANRYTKVPVLANIPNLNSKKGSKYGYYGYGYGSSQSSNTSNFKKFDKNTGSDTGTGSNTRTGSDTGSDN